MVYGPDKVMNVMDELLHLMNVLWFAGRRCLAGPPAYGTSSTNHATQWQVCIIDKLNKACSFINYIL